MRRAAIAAGNGLNRDRQRLGELAVHNKLGPADVFSEADLAAEATIRDVLMRASPTFGFMGEEGGLEPGSDPDYVWIVDPLDGTTNFLTGTPLFAVNIALARAGEVIAGVTCAPAMNELFYAELGGGAYLNDKPIRISDRMSLGRSVLAVGIPFASKPHHNQFVTEMARLTTRVAGVRRLGAGALDLAWVACGRFDAYWEQDTSAWDIAAGTIMVREAGGIVTNTTGGPLDLMGRTILAATPAIHTELVTALLPA